MEQNGLIGEATDDEIDRSPNKNQRRINKIQWALCMPRLYATPVCFFLTLSRIDIIAKETLIESGSKGPSSLSPSVFTPT
eukprot:gene12869-8748_t